MRKSTAILTTIILGAALAIGSVSNSMARGGDFAGDRGFGRGYGGPFLGRSPWICSLSGFGHRATCRSRYQD